MALSAARPLVSIRPLAEDAKMEQVVLPSVFLAPIRNDIVSFVHANMAKNRRQAYAVSSKAGHQHSAESWGTGRAVSRIPRVSGGGTGRSGQGAFGNMCRKGHMYAPTKTWRKWHRKINVNQKRFAVASALAASALPSLVQARGHRIESIAEVPLVIDGIETMQKTKEAVAALKAIGAYEDVQKVKDSRKIRAGVGKMRNRRHVQRRGPLIVFNEDKGVVQAFRNIPGVELANVERLNLLQLAPGGHLGRFVIWSGSAFKRLNEIWGSFTGESQLKSGYKLPAPLMLNSDLPSLINSSAIQSVVRPAIKSTKRFSIKKNPLKNLGVLVRLNPYALAARRSELLAQERQQKAKAAAVEAAREGKKLPLSREEQVARAAKRTHAPQKRVNYRRIVEDNYKPEKLQLKIHKPRDRLAAGEKPAADGFTMQKVEEKKTKEVKESVRRERKELPFGTAKVTQVPFKAAPRKAEPKRAAPKKEATEEGGDAKKGKGKGKGGGGKAAPKKK